MINKISIENTVQRIDGHIVSSELGDDLVMMDLANGSYISMNKTGRLIWQQIEKPILVKDLIRYLTDKFKVEESICTAETLCFLNTLKQQKALTIHPM